MQIFLFLFFFILRILRSFPPRTKEEGEGYRELQFRNGREEKKRTEVARHRPLAFDASEWRLNGLQNDGQLHSPLSVAVEGGEVECRRAHSWHGYEATHLPLFYTATDQPSSLFIPLSQQGAAATDHHHHHHLHYHHNQRWLPPLFLLQLSTPSLLALFHSASPTPFRRIVRLYRGCDVAFFPLILGRGEGLNGETNHRLSFSSLALLFSDSSGTVRSLASRDSMCRARPILTGFNSVFEGVRRKITWAGRQRERKKGGIDERAARF